MYNVHKYISVGHVLKILIPEKHCKMGVLMHLWHKIRAESQYSCRDESSEVLQKLDSFMQFRWCFQDFSGAGMIVERIRNEYVIKAQVTFSLRLTRCF